MRVKLREQCLHFVSTFSVSAFVVVAILSIFLDLGTLTTTDGMLFLEAIERGLQRLREQLLTCALLPRAQSQFSKGRWAPQKSPPPEALSHGPVTWQLCLPAPGPIC